MQNLKRLLLLPLCFSLFLPSAWGASPQLSPMPANMRVDSFARGERVYAIEDQNFAVDQKTMRDLEFDTAFLPHLVNIAATELGRNRLRWILTHPLEHREDIIERQRLIQTLAANPELLAALNQLFEELAKETNQASIKDQIHTITKTSYAAPTSLMAFTFGATFAMGALSASAAFVTGQLALAAAAAQIGAITASTIGAARRNLMVPTLQKIRAASAGVQQAFARASLEDQRTLEGALKICEEQKSCLSSVHGVNAALGASGVSAFAMNATMLANPLIFVSRAVTRKNMPQIVAWLGALAEIEAYAALATFYASNKDALIFPEILADEKPVVRIENGHLPYLRFSDKVASIGNNVELAEGEDKTAILTGPNAGGKTTYLRMIATNLILAQTGAPIPADSAAITPMKVATNFANEKDSSTEGLSTFQAQSKRIAQLLDAVEKRRADQLFSFVAMDEILVGTSELEHTALEMAVLENIYREKNLVSVLATHYRALTALESEADGVKNISVDIRGYAIKDGASEDYNALEVASDQGVPKRIISRAQTHLEALRETGSCASFLE